MKQQRPIHIKHPDLSQMRDDQLENEIKYLFEYAQRICNQVMQQLRAFEKADVPTWKIVEDLQLVNDRHDAIREEIFYREQMMR